MPRPMFADLQPAAPDAILGLADAFRRDPRSGKVNLAVGVYQDEAGQTPILTTVAEVERRLAEKGASKSYLPIGGDRFFTGPAQGLVFGEDHEALRAQRVETLQTPGGTGALRVAADLVHGLVPGATAWLSTPTWPNHAQIFQAAGLSVRWYPYLREDGQGVDEDGMFKTLADSAPGDIVVVHACCHNPTGADISSGAWKKLAWLAADRGVLPVLDFAYQGFGDGLDADAAGVRAMARDAEFTFFVASSMSKNFAVYAERVGALSLVCRSPDAAAALASHARAAARACYSNPPAHGAEIVATILRDPELRSNWMAEVANMRNRINENRSRLVETLVANGAAGGPGAPIQAAGLLLQRGMFSLLGLSAGQVARLRDEFGVYVVSGGRINVAGLTKANLEVSCKAIAAVLT